MSEVTVTIPLSAALNIRTLILERMKEIEKLATEYPDLPMKDPITWESYRSALYEFTRETARITDGS
jgi:hypothetical protein